MSVNVMAEQEKRKAAELLFKKDQLDEAKRQKLVQEAQEQQRLDQHNQLVSNQQNQFAAMMQMMQQSIDTQAKQTELLIKLTQSMPK